MGAPDVVARLIEAAELVLDDDGVDLSTCPYWAKWNGDIRPDEDQSCGFGCVTEPECVTCMPEGGWPRDRLRAAVAAVNVERNPNTNPRITWNRPEPPTRFTHYVWDDDETCPLGWVPVCRKCDNGPLTGDEEMAGVCSDCDAREE